MAPDADIGERLCLAFKSGLDLGISIGRLAQTVLAVLTHTICMLVMPVSLATTARAAVKLFLLGHILFFSAYAGGAPAGAIGFALTFYPSIFMLLIILFWIIPIGKL